MISDVDSILVGHDLRQEATSLHTATLQVNDGKNTAVTCQVVITLTSETVLFFIFKTKLLRAPSVAQLVRTLACQHSLADNPLIKGSILRRGDINIGTFTVHFSAELYQISGSVC